MAAKTTWAAVLQCGGGCAGGARTRRTRTSGASTLALRGIGRGLHPRGRLPPDHQPPRAVLEPYGSFRPKLRGRPSRQAGASRAVRQHRASGGGYQALTTANVFTSAEAGLGPGHHPRLPVGAYGRVYPMAFFKQLAPQPRVFFRLVGRPPPPLLNRGSRSASVRSTAAAPTATCMALPSASWTTTTSASPSASASVPLQPLAVGLGHRHPARRRRLGRNKVIRQITTGSDTTSRSARSYAPAADANAAFSVTLNVRYTLTPRG